MSATSKRLASCLSFLVILLMLQSIACFPFLSRDLKEPHYKGSLFQRFLERRTSPEPGGLYIRESTTSQCSSLSVDDLRKLPKWADLDRYAKKLYGDKNVEKANIVTNPTDQPDKGAVLCTDIAKPVRVTTKGNPICTSHVSDIEGTFNDITGLITVTLEQGYSNQGTWTVTKASQLARSKNVSALFYMDTTNIGGSVTTTTKFKNQQDNAFTTYFDNIVTQTLNITNHPNKHCYAELSSKSCIVGGNTKARLTASGYAWFNFQKPVGSSDGADGGKRHYKWALKIEDVIKSEDGRSTWIEIAGNMNGTTRTHYKALCK